MSRILDRVLILAALLFVAMLWQESEAQEGKPKDRDLFNMKEFEDRQTQFAREIRLEKQS